MKTAFNGVLADAAHSTSAFNRKVKLVWIGAGTARSRTQDVQHPESSPVLDRAGIRSVCREPPGAAHAWLPWRRWLNQFAPLLF